ncbi:GntR family transcriptional regulator [Rhodoplanes sp. TEM]|uniref:GntR family transcriptional regulator n=1 Tax=Rhodoplanes tepidamans TaxID=200616 RepID=A0ABT5J8T6_RHOTP|nr:MULTISPECIES: GntR family transcriptional regulator [Rhodoplanes]MDC7786029.1 GntR family transcriptional regulator [Rhodoplanes tepidamans]MDC7983830.1 GntR family transcriptional regulator [Rhodoplanes sp. TEM]MDQ0354871.1 DNA-binding GntR family transcriptional regulator [Rhodoplanes tepidamans]
MARDSRTAGKRLGEQHDSLHNLIYQEIRSAIADGRLKPGERLVEERLAEEYGVSRNPIREAIRALHADGLVDVSSRRGAHVAGLAPDTVREIIEIRALLESHNARLAARNRNAVLLKNAEAILTRGRTALTSGRRRGLRELNEQFHRALAEAGRNQLLSDMLESLRTRSALLFSPDDPARQEVSWQEHAGILQAIVDGDEELAAKRAMAHVLGAGEAHLQSTGAAATAAGARDSAGELPQKKQERR